MAASRGVPTIDEVIALHAIAVKRATADAAAGNRDARKYLHALEPDAKRYHARRALALQPAPDAVAV